MGALVRLVLLLGAVATIGLGGYWSIKHDLHEIIRMFWSEIVFFVQTFDITVVIRAAMVWLKRMGTHWLLIEVPKRVLIISIVPYVILWLLPATYRRRLRVWLTNKRLWLLTTKNRFLAWLHAEHMFGDYAWWAIGLLLALVFFIFFYSAFWVYLALWLGFIKIPAIVTAVLSYVWGKLLFLVQKIPFANLLFKWVNVVSVWVARHVPHIHLVKRTPEERKRRARARVRYAIRKRYDRKLFLRVGWREYHRLRKLKQAEDASSEPPSKNGDA